MRKLVVGALLLIACKSSSKTSTEEQPKTVEPAKPTTEDKPAAGSATTRAPTPLAVKTLELRTGEPFKLIKGTVKAVTTAGGELPLVDDHAQAEGTALISSTKPNGEAISWTLVELASGKTLATFSALYTTGSHSKKAVIDAKEGTMALLDLTSGAIHVPTIELAGTTVAESRIVVDDERDVVWVFAKGADNKGYVARWTDVTAPLKTFTALPHWPTMIENAPSVLAWPEERPDTCARFLVADGAAPACEPEGAGEHVLANRYWPVVEGNTMFVHDQKTGTRTTILDGCASTVLSMMSQPPRILVGCVVDGEKSTTIAVWSPDKTWTGKIGVEHHGWHLAGGPLERSVVIPADMLGSQAPFHGWLDIETGTTWDTPPLVPLTYAPYGGIARRFVARGEKDPKELWWVDLEAGTLEKIASDVACAHELQTMNQPGNTPDRVLIRCVEETSTGAQRKPGSWSEIVDGKARTRTRIDNFAADHVYADGRAIGITLTGPRRVALLAR